MTYALTLIQSDGSITTTVFDQPEVTVGRSSSNDLKTDPVLYSQVSRKHGQFICRGPQEYIYEDLNSTQGSFLDGRKLSGRVLLNRDDTVVLGKEGPGISITWPRERITGHEGTHYRMFERPSPAFPLAFAEEFLAKYRHYVKIGAGGFGEVWRGIPHTGTHDVAIKLLHPMLMNPDHMDDDDRHSLIRRFSREAQLTHQLSLSGVDGIVPVHSWGDDADKDYLYLVMDYIEGIPLDSLIRNYDRMTYEEAALYFRQVASALQAAHDFEFTDDHGHPCRGVVHRDIKPGNLLVQPEHGKAWIVDFGVAGISEGGERLTSSNIAVGTHLYLPPEAITSKEVTPATDLWAFTVTLYLALSGGQFPFPPLEHGLRHERVTEEDYHPIEYHHSTLPVEIAQAIRRSLSPEPSDRVQSAREWAQLLSTF